MGTSVAVLNQKGGVGKTTVTLGLASAARAAGASVLVVDLDPQGSATWALGVDAASVDYGIADAIAANRSRAGKAAIWPSAWGDDIAVAPATIDLIQRDAEHEVRRAELRLRKALDGLEDDYDLILFDCPPSLGLNTRNALAAANLALLVVEPALLSLRGVSAVYDLIDEIWAEANSDLDIAGVVVNREPPVSALARNQEEELGKQVGKRLVWKPFVPQRVVITEALSNRMPIHDMGARAAEVADIFDKLYNKLRRAAARREE